MARLQDFKVGQTVRVIPGRKLAWRGAPPNPQTGTVIEVSSNGSLLEIDFPGWPNGHQGNGKMDLKGSRWFINYEQLDILSDTPKTELKVGDRVRIDVDYTEWVGGEHNRPEVQGVVVRPFIADDTWRFARAEIDFPGWTHGHEGSADFDTASRWNIPLKYLQVVHDEPKKSTEIKKATVRGPLFEVFAYELTARLTDYAELSREEHAI
jgi:hypothetical protein